MNFLTYQSLVNSESFDVVLIKTDFLLFITFNLIKNMISYTPQVKYDDKIIEEVVLVKIPRSLEQSIVKIDYKYQPNTYSFNENVGDYQMNNTLPAIISTQECNNTSMHQPKQKDNKSKQPNHCDCSLSCCSPS